VRERPVLLYDGDCAFCSSCARFIERRVPTSAEILAWQLTDLSDLGVTPEAAAEAVLWVDVDGSVAAGHLAVAWLLVDADSFWRPLGYLLSLPPLRWLGGPVYRLVARNRHRLPGGTTACALPPTQRDAAKRV
jgi:predicted DCC family thiol-disulfide oxidoreductase YuxK